MKIKYLFITLLSVQAQGDSSHRTIMPNRKGKANCCGKSAIRDPAVRRKTLRFSWHHTAPPSGSWL
jgi:hypothetical protein